MLLVWPVHHGCLWHLRPWASVQSKRGSSGTAQLPLRAEARCRGGQGLADALFQGSARGTMTAFLPRRSHPHAGQSEANAQRAQRARPLSHSRAALWHEARSGVPGTCQDAPCWAPPPPAPPPASPASPLLPARGAPSVNRCHKAPLRLCLRTPHLLTATVHIWNIPDR